MSVGHIGGTVEVPKHYNASGDWPATLACGDAAIACSIANLSANGATVMLDDPPEGKTRITLSAAFGTLEGDIVWRSPSALGIRFVLAPDLVATLLGDKLATPQRRSGAAA